MNNQPLLLPVFLPVRPRLRQLQYLAACSLAAACSALHAGQYFQDFSSSSVGATNFGDGSTLFSTALGSAGGAEVQDSTYMELQLTESGYTGVRSAFELPALDPAAPVQAFSAKWNSQVYGAFPNAADGFSFNFGQLSALNLTNGSVESGYAAGLGFSVQNYVSNNPGFYLRVNGTTLVSQSFNPATQWQTNNTTRHFFEVDWNYTNGVTVRVDGLAIFSNVPASGFTPQAGDVFVWAARCGAASEEVRLDNIVVVTGGNLVQVPTGSPYYADANSDTVQHSAANAFDGNPNTYWITYATLGFVGATVNPSAVALVYTLSSSPDIGLGNTADPHLWTLQGSNDQGANWASCGSGGGYFLNRQETRGWLATNSTAYGAFRLLCGQNNGSGFTALGDLRLYQYNPVFLPPTALTAPVNLLSSNTAALNSTVNPGGGDTTAWFEWGATTNYGNTTAAQDIGSGLGNVGATASLTGLSPHTTYHCQVVASNNAGVSYGGDISFTTFPAVDIGWTPANVDSNRWQSIAMSVDGRIMIAAAAFDYTQLTLSNVGQLYLSTNYGVTWGSLGLPTTAWTSVASSRNGDVLLGVAQPAVVSNPTFGLGGGFAISTNYGATWNLRYDYGGQEVGLNDIINIWTGAASSADGHLLYAISEEANYGPESTYIYGLPYYSFGEPQIGLADGLQWSPFYFPGADTGATNGVPFETWHCIAASADGTNVLMGADEGLFAWSFTNYLYLLTTWEQMPVPVVTTPYYGYGYTSVAISADGTKMAAINFDYARLYISANSGATWAVPFIPGSVYSVAMSADGTKMVAAGAIPYLSTDSGATWRPISSGLPVTGALGGAVAMSGDGSTVAFGGIGGFTNGLAFGGSIFIWHLPSLQTQVLGHSLAVSWTTNQTGLVLQTTTNLAAPNWTAATNAVTMTNGQYQVLLSPAGGDQFFRLGAQ
jgi:hypothetical protein